MQSFYLFTARSTSEVEPRLDQVGSRSEDARQWFVPDREHQLLRVEIVEDFVQELEPEIGRRIRDVLGTERCLSIVVDVSRRPGAGTCARRFAIEMMNGTCALAMDDNSERLWKLADLSAGAPPFADGY